VTRPTTSASNIFRRKLCPGSEKLEAGLPEEETELSVGNTRLHQYYANPKLDRSFLNTQSQDLLRIADDLDSYVFSRVRDQFQLSEGFEEGFERELIALKGEDGETPGHCDRYRYWPEDRFLLILDVKFGFKVVTPANANLQLRTYAMGAFEQFDVEDCVVAITQPRLPYGQRVTLAAYDRNEMALAREELGRIRAASRREDAPLIAGEEQCRYCKARVFCPAIRAELVILEQLMYGRI
jgi:hypothetical protein